MCDCLWLLARKKTFIYISYLTGILVFISLSYSTANKLYYVPIIVQSFTSTSLSVINQTLSISPLSLHHDDQNEFEQNKCSYGNVRSLSNVIRKNNMINHLGFVLRSHSLFYCSVPKVATRTILKFITYLHIRDDLIPLLTNNSTLPWLNSYPELKSMNITNMFNFNQSIFSSSKDDSSQSTNSLLTSFLSRLMVINNSSKIDLWSMYQNKVFRLIRPATLFDPSILFSSNFLRAIFVRHPLERLASAYIDKITSLNVEPFSSYDNLRRVICRRFSSFYLTDKQRMAYRIKRGLSKQIDEPCEKVIPTFEHFVNYLMSDSLQDDVHWQSYSKLCQVCTLKYNFIGKYETIEEDLNRFLTHLGLKSIYSNDHNYFTTGKTRENYKSMYSQLPKRLICDLKYFYKDDFRLFDYRLEDYLNDQTTVQCSMRHDPFFRKKFRGK